MKRALVIGVGGLGCSASLGLAKQGIDLLTLADPDKVDPTNLHRQPWHRSSDVGRLKVESAADGLRAAFPALKVATSARAVDHLNAVDLLLAHDLVIDATDGVAGKFLLSDASRKTGVPLIYGGALKMAGQVMPIVKGGPCLRCLFEAPPPEGSVPTCAQAGVLGSLVGFIGAWQALLARDVLAGKKVAGRLWSFDGATLKMRELQIKKAPECDVCRMEPEKLRLQPVSEMACAS